MPQPPTLLALETSTERLSLAIMKGERVWVREVDAGQRHSELAMAELAALFAEANLKLTDMDAIAFGQGPGSFVGVRIACGLAQGLALGAGKRLIAVPTQLALAEQALLAPPGVKSEAARVLVAIDARMGEFYVAAYELDQTEVDHTNQADQKNQADASGWRVVVAPMLAKADQLPAIASDGFFGIGSAFDVPVLRAQLLASYAGKISRVLENRLPSTSDVGRIASRQWAKLGTAAGITPELAAPLYLRNHVAMTIVERQASKALQKQTQQAKAVA